MAVFSGTERGIGGIIMVLGTLVAVLTTVALISKGKKRDSVTPPVPDDGWEEVLGI
jgi:hypothetical protein